MIPHTNAIKIVRRNDGSIDVGVIRFKTEGEYQEFYDPKMSARLQLIAFSIGGFVQQYQPYTDTVITEVWRSEEERKNIYPLGHKLHFVKGAHERWEAIDIRVWNLEPITLASLFQFFSQTNLPHFRGLVIFHKIVDGVYHFHIQLKRN